MHSVGDWQTVKGALSQDLVTLAAYLQTWRLKLSWSKTVSAVFLLNNREAGRKLNVTLDGKCLPFTQTPNIPGCETGQVSYVPRTSRITAWKTNFTCCPYRQLAGLGWGASALGYSTAECCTPVWCCSVPICIINTAINDALHIATGCLRPTPLDNPPILAGIQSAELC